MVHDTILSVMKVPVGVASSHDTIAVRRGGLPQKKRSNFIGK